MVVETSGNLSARSRFSVRTFHALGYFMKANCLLPVLLLAFASVLFWGEREAAWAFDSIEGAFGMKLGAKYLPSAGPGSSTVLDGAPAYFFKPASPSHLFDLYVVQITPASHLIHSIIGVGRSKDVETCDKDRGAMLSSLTEQYGASTKWGLEQVSGHYFDFDIILQSSHNRGIGIGCSGTSPIIFQIIYLDDDLANLAKRESGNEEDATARQREL